MQPSNHVPRRAITKQTFKLPAWWMQLAPGKPASFWVRVEREREAAGVRRSDTSAIEFIVKKMLVQYQPKPKGVFYMKTVDSIIDSLVSKQTTKVEAEKPEPIKAKTPASTSYPSRSQSSGPSYRGTSTVSRQAPRFVGFSEQEQKAAGLDKKKPKPNRPPYKLFPDSASLEWDLLEAEKVLRSDTFDTWIDRVGYEDLCKDHDEAVYNIAARIFLRKKRAEHMS
jgi:hypothetical protein